jgi:hypothetical protein
MIAPTHAAPPAFGPPLRCEPGQVAPVLLPELVTTPAKLPSRAALPPPVLAGRPAVITPPLPTVWLRTTAEQDACLNRHIPALAGAVRSCGCRSLSKAGYARWPFSAVDAAPFPGPHRKLSTDLVAESPVV